MKEGDGMTSSKHICYRTVISITFYLCFSFFALAITAYAWFTITNQNDARLISDLTEIETSYQFYVYQDHYNQGDQLKDLYNQLCLDTEVFCYKEIEEPTINHLFNGSIAPGSRFSFALVITNLTDKQAYLKLDFGGIRSTQAPDAYNLIQIAFEYQVTKISYMNEGVETPDRSTYHPIIRYQNHFGLSSNELYPIVKNVPTLDIYTGSNELIVYFELYFDPSIYGRDLEGNPYPNSNIFMNQTLWIEHLYMMITIHPEEGA